MQKTWAIVAALAVLGAGIAPVVLSTATAQAAPTMAAQAFAIDKMTCAMCPITVKKAMQAVPGVHDVSIDFDRKTALVRYDPVRTDARAIATASTNAGYPASPVRIRTGG